MNNQRETRVLRCVFCDSTDVKTEFKKGDVAFVEKTTQKLIRVCYKCLEDD